MFTSRELILRNSPNSQLDSHKNYNPNARIASQFTFSFDYFSSKASKDAI